MKNSKLTPLPFWHHALALGAGVVLLVCLPARTTGAAQGDGLTIDEVVAEALRNNPERRFFEAEIAVARAGQRLAGRLANPELSSSIGQKFVRADGLRAEGLAWSVSVVQPFEWPGRIGLRKAIANRDLELAELGFDRFRIALAGRVRTLAFGVFAAREKAAAAAEVAERFSALREVMLARDPAGLTPLLETRVIEATELNALRTASEAGLAAESALLELNQLRGAPAGSFLQIRASDDAVPSLPETATLVAMARTNNFELRVRAAELAQQGFRVALARNERYPALAIGPTYEEENAGGEREQFIGLGLSLPLPLWNRNTDNIAAAEARQLQAETSLFVLERELERKVLAAALAVETRRREMARWRPDAIEHFREAAALADRHYRLGAVPISTYVELQKQYLDAIDGLLDTRKEALEAVAELELLTGLTLPADGPQSSATQLESIIQPQ
jgi:cobalt-zinc-cadmium efflux system outer membrane protein